MPFEMPSLEGVSQTLRRAVPTYFPKARADFWPNNLVIIAKVIALGCYEALLRARWVYKQIFISTASDEHLELHGAELGLQRRPALVATGVASLAPTSLINLPIGTLFVAETGAFYVSTTAAVGTGTVLVDLAAQNAGSSGNLPAGTTVRLVSPISELMDEYPLTLGAGGGADIEGVEAYRARLLDRLRSRPRGGNADDYRYWVREAGGFDAVFIKAWAPGAGRVTLYPLKPGSGAARLPTVPDLTALAEKMELRRPLCAELVLGQAAGKIIDVAISDLDGDTEATRREIYAELADMFDERGVVALPGDVTTFSKSWIDEAVSRAAGEGRHVLASPLADVALLAGEYPILGNVSYP